MCLIHMQALGFALSVKKPAGLCVLRANMEKSFAKTYGRNFIGLFFKKKKKKEGDIWLHVIIGIYFLEYTGAYIYWLIFYQ